MMQECTAARSDGALGKRSAMVVENLTIAGEPSKRYRMVYWGEIVGGWDSSSPQQERNFARKARWRVRP
jgi:hypothetical protein